MAIIQVRIPTPAHCKNMVKAGLKDPTLNLKPYVVPLPTHFNTNELPTYELGSLSMLQKKFYGLFLKSGQLL